MHSVLFLFHVTRRVYAAAEQVQYSFKSHLKSYRQEILKFVDVNNDLGPKSEVTRPRPRTRYVKVSGKKVNQS